MILNINSVRRIVALITEHVNTQKNYGIGIFDYEGHMVVKDLKKLMALAKLNGKMVKCNKFIAVLVL